MYYNKKVESISMEEAMESFQSDERFLKQEYVNNYFISTIFLVIDHNMTDKGRPVLFETMVFGGKEGWEDLEQERYYTEEEALEGHKRIVNKYNNK